jgi:hypothetical protein
MNLLFLQIIPIRLDLVPHVIIKTRTLYGEERALRAEGKTEQEVFAIREAEMKSGQLKITPGLTTKSTMDQRQCMTLQPQS